MAAGIPTLYRGIQYRSRLEARWAAFFDLLGWRFQYEPFDLNGWIPDFLLVGARTLVEVKPIFHFDTDVAAKIDRAGVPEDYEVMIVGCVVPIPDQYRLDASDGRAVGWLRANPPCWRPELSPRWGRAIVQVFEDRVAKEMELYPNEGIGFYHEYDCAMRQDPGYPPRPQITDGAHDRFAWGNTLQSWGVYVPGSLDRLNDFWNQAGNAVQWRGHRSEVH